MSYYLDEAAACTCGLSLALAEVAETLLVLATDAVSARDAAQLVDADLFYILEQSWQILHGERMEDVLGSPWGRPIFAAMRSFFAALTPRPNPLLRREQPAEQPAGQPAEQPEEPCPNDCFGN